MHVWKALKESRKFWIAIVAIIQTVLFSAIPDFPEEIWLAIDKLAIALMGTIAAEDMAKKIAEGIKHSNAD